MFDCRNIGECRHAFAFCRPVFKQLVRVGGYWCYKEHFIQDHRLNLAHSSRVHFHIKKILGLEPIFYQLNTFQDKDVVWKFWNRMKLQNWLKAWAHLCKNMNRIGCWVKNGRVLLDIKGWMKICDWVENRGGVKTGFQMILKPSSGPERGSRAEWKLQVDGDIFTSVRLHYLKRAKRWVGRCPDQPLPFLRGPSGPIQCHQPSSTLLCFQTNKIRQTKKNRPHSMPSTLEYIYISFQNMSTKYCDYKRIKGHLHIFDLR